jgi:hypothetical protein
MTTATAVVWASDFVQKRHDEIGKCTVWYLIECRSGFMKLPPELLQE